jgi:hypothetical protein
MKMQSVKRKKNELGTLIVVLKIKVVTGCSFGFEVIV